MTPFALDNPDYHLLLPVLLFCADDHRRPVVPGTDAAVVKRLRHQAPDDIPAFVEEVDARPAKLCDREAQSSPRFAILDPSVRA